MDRRPICAWTCLRSWAIIRCAALESSCVSVKEVTPCIAVAAMIARASGASSPTWRLPMTLSTRNFVEAGSTNPASRLMAIKTRPKSKSTRCGRRNGHASLNRTTSPADFPFTGCLNSVARPWLRTRGSVLPVIPVIAILSIVVYLGTKCPPAGAFMVQNPSDAPAGHATPCEVPEMILETERLVLRNWRESDVGHYLVLANDVGYNCFSPPGYFLARTTKEASAKIRERMLLFQERKLGKFPIFLRATGEFIGTCGMEPFDLSGRRVGLSALSQVLGGRLCKGSSHCHPELWPWRFEAGEDHGLCASAK